MNLTEMTIKELFERSENLPFDQFCRLMKTDPVEMNREMDMIKVIYLSKGKRLVSVQNVRTVRWMLNRSEKVILYSLPDSQEYWQYVQLVEYLRGRLEKATRLDRKTWQPSKRRGLIW